MLLGKAEKQEIERENLYDVIEQLVTDGVAWLDENYNSGKYWIWSVNPKTLEMYSSDLCIIGQLFGEFAVTYTFNSGYEISDTEELGFSIDMMADESSLNTGEVYDMLTDAWVRRIEHLRAEMTKRG